MNLFDLTASFSECLRPSFVPVLFPNPENCVMGILLYPEFTIYAYDTLYVVGPSCFSFGFLVRADNDRPWDLLIDT
jgi:hypothetical protein